ncbi:MAG TPA: flagellar basal body-associated FliL family protein [Burkholderiales bacterium]
MAKQPEATARPQDVPLDQPPKKKTSKKKIIFLILLALLISAAGGAGIMFATQPASDADGETDAVATAAEAKRTHAPSFLALEPFVVNLRGEDGDNYLRVGVVLEASDEVAIETAKTQLPRIRNGIILLLSSKTTDDISSMEGKQQLMQEILLESRKPMTLPEPTKGIESVYLSDFVIQ